MNDNMDFTMKFEHKKDEEKMDEKEVVNFVYEAWTKYFNSKFIYLNLQKLFGLQLQFLKL